MREFRLPRMLCRMLLAFEIAAATAVIAIGACPSEAHAELVYADLLGDKAVAEYNLSLSSTPYKHENGKRYWSADGAKKREPWCADFVSYCAEKASLMKAGCYPKRSRSVENGKTALTCNCGSIMRWVLAHGGVWYDNDGTYIPKKGDLCFRKDGSIWGHVGIVSRNAELSTFNVVEGNKSNMLSRGNYKYKTADWTGFVRITKGMNTGVRIDNARISGISGCYLYTGRAIKPDVRLRVGGRALCNGSDYTVRYASNVNPGKATATASPKSGSRNYGTRSTKFKIGGTTGVESASSGTPATATASGRLGMVNASTVTSALVKKAIAGKSNKANVIIGPAVKRIEAGAFSASGSVQCVQIRSSALKTKAALYRCLSESEVRKLYIPSRYMPTQAAKNAVKSAFVKWSAPKRRCMVT